MEFQDRILQCVDCGAEFVWTAGEQQFFADKNFKNEPKRCKACKGKRASRPAGAVARERVETVTMCSARSVISVPVSSGSRVTVRVPLSGTADHSPARRSKVAATGVGLPAAHNE